MRNEEAEAIAAAYGDTAAAKQNAQEELAPRAIAAADGATAAATPFEIGDGVTAPAARSKRIHRGRRCRSNRRIKKQVFAAFAALIKQQRSGDRIAIQEAWCQQIQVHVERYLLGHAMWDED